MNPSLFSAIKTDWETPQSLFQQLNHKYGPCNLDVCAWPLNAKCKKFYSPWDNGLKQSWKGVCWLNPPYGRETSLWLEKAVREIALKNASRVIALLPARTDTRWWHQLVMPHALIIHFLKGRVRFVNARSSAPFPSVVVVYDKSTDLRAHPIIIGQ